MIGTSVPFENGIHSSIAVKIIHRGMCSAIGTTPPCSRGLVENTDIGSLPKCRMAVISSGAQI